jgi:hypothetical protein
MADEEIRPVPYVAFTGVMDQVRRMGSEGIPDKIDKKYLVGMADGTQFQYRQAFRFLGLATNNDQPTPLLSDLILANSADRRKLFGKILSTQWPDLVGLPPDASSDDFFAVLQDRYGVGSDVQRRKMRTFFVAAADYARLQISPHIRPSKARPGPRQPKESSETDTSPTQQMEAAVHPPTVRADQDGPDANGGGGERRDILLGDAGSVSVVVNVRWLDLPEDQFLKLRKLIKDIEALGDSGN